MEYIRLDGRLTLCAEYVREGSRLADIGTDHGYLPISLVQRGVAASALACDINPMPLSSARENIARYHLEDKISVRLSDGLSSISPNEVDDIVIAGMGGELIVRILSDCAWVKDGAKRLILQPMTRYEKLLSWLYQNGFAIDSQRAAFSDGKYYTVICARYTGEQTPCDLYRCVVGALEPEDELSRAFLTKTAEKLRKQAKGDSSLLPVIEQLEVLL